MVEGGSADDLIEKALAEEKEARSAKNKAKRTLNANQTNKAPYRPIPQLLPISTGDYATLSLISSNDKRTGQNKLSPQKTTPLNGQLAPAPISGSNSMPNVPENIENGSLVVLTVDDPNEPSKKMLQTYISHGAGKLTPVALPPALLNSVVTYMKKGTPKSGMSSSSSPQLLSPSSVASQESRSSVIQFNPSPLKRKRNSSFTITQL